ncbi:MAG: hypothetical protein JWP25_7100 [Bradyrhizobium sp.]|jgi:hypothetical protein|nr:hypothetical protein [Bradyrhizobium sp.]
MTSCAYLAAIIKQSLANVFPNGMWAAEPYRVESLYLDTTRAAGAFHPEQFARK